MRHTPGMTMGDRTTSMRPAGWYTDPEDATRLRKWDGRGWTDSWMKGPGTALDRAGTATGLVHTGTPPGWYPDPAEPELNRWWDGTRWTPQVLAGRVFPGRTELGSGFSVLGRFLAGLLALNALVGVAALGVTIWSSSVVGRWLTDLDAVDPAEAERYDDVHLALGVVAGLLFLATAVLFVVWLRRAYGSNRVDPAALRFGAGWSIGAWFVPFLNLVRPFGLVRDLGRGLGERGEGAGFHRLVPAWWAAWLLMNLADSASRTVGQNGDDLDPVGSLRYLHRWLWVDAVSAVLMVVAGVLAALLVLRVTRAIEAGRGQRPVPVAAPTA